MVDVLNVVPVAVEPRDGLRIWLKYSDGVEGVLDMSHLKGKGVFKAWNDRAYFEGVHINKYDVVSWGPDGDGYEIDCDPESMYVRLVGVDWRDFEDMESFYRAIEDKMAEREQLEYRADIKRNQNSEMTLNDRQMSFTTYPMPDVTLSGEGQETCVRLILDDSLDKMLKLDRGSIHLIVTDPPYHLDGLDSKWRKGREGAPRGTGSVGGLPVGMKFDPKQGKVLQDFMEIAGIGMIHALAPGGFALVFSQPRLVHRMAIGLEDAGFEIRDLFAWHFTNKAQFKAFKMDHFIDRMNISQNKKQQIKQVIGGRKTPQLRPQFESIILAQKPREGTFVQNYLKYQVGLIESSESLDGKAPSTVMPVDKPSKSPSNIHLTVKPIELIEHLIRLFSESGQTVLDPFLGSGTTAIAARRTQRDCIGIEINPDYIEIAKTRLQEET